MDMNTVTDMTPLSEEEIFNRIEQLKKDCELKNTKNREWTRIIDSLRDLDAKENGFEIIQDLESGNIARKDINMGLRCSVDRSWEYLTDSDNGLLTYIVRLKLPKNEKAKSEAELLAEFYKDKLEEELIPMFTGNPQQMEKDIDGKYTGKFIDMPYQTKIDAIEGHCAMIVACEDENISKSESFMKLSQQYHIDYHHKWQKLVEESKSKAGLQ